jgi:catechol 2,3-dioxygenase-like lactoylglutathione lyase family enzyme
VSDPNLRRVFIDHLVIRVRDIARSRAFYEAALTPLGIEVIEMADGREVVFGPRGSEDFIVAAADDEHPASGPAHMAFAAASPEEVVAFHAAGLAAGGIDNGAPGLRPQYHPGYHGAFLIDPDGNNVEAVFHDRSSRA